MNHYSVVNYHVTNRCNFHCSYCFAKFKEPEASLTDAKTVVDNIASYFRECGITDGRINFAGGEPLLYRHLDELIDYAMRSGAPLEVIENLQELEDEGDVYESIEDVWPDYPSKEDFLFNEDEY